MVVFKQDAADAPDVTRVTPPQLWKRTDDRLKPPNVTDRSRVNLRLRHPSCITHDDLRGSVVTGGDERRVVFVVIGGAAKVNEANCCVVYSPLIALLEEDSRGRHLSKNIVIVIHHRHDI